MAGRSELEIGLNIDGAKRSFIELKNEAKALSKSNFQLFSKEEKQFLSGQAKNILTDLNKKVSENKDLIARQVSEMQKLERGTTQYSKAEEHINRLLKDRTKLLKSQQEYAQFDKESLRSKGFPGALAGMGKKATGGLLGGMGGALGALGPLGLAAGGIAGAGAFALSRIMGGVSTYKQGVGDRIALRGLGVGDLELQNRRRAAELGLNAQDVRAQRVGAIRTLGREAGSQENVLRRAAFERAYGLESGSQTGLAAQLRGNLGGAGASQAIFKLQGSIIASGIDEALGPYLETATSLLSEINENGILNSDQIITALSTLVKDGKNTPEQVARAFTSMQGAIQGSTGERNAFFQQIFARAGIGGKTIGGTKLAIESGGLFGLNREDLAKKLGPGKTVQTMEKLGFTTGFQTIGKAILDDFKRQSGLKPGESVSNISNPKQLERLMLIANSMLGTSGTTGLLQTKMLESALKGGPKAQADFQKAIEDLNKSPELKNLELIKNSMAGQTNAIEKLSETVKDEMGNQFVPAANKMVELLTSIDHTITSLFGWAVGESPTKQLNDQIKGTGTISPEAFSQATWNNPMQAEQASKQAGAEYAKNAARIRALEQETAPYMGASSFARPESFYKSKHELDRLKERQSNIELGGMNVKGFSPQKFMGAELSDQYYKNVQMKGLEKGAMEQQGAASYYMKQFLNDFKSIFGAGMSQEKLLEAMNRNTEAVKSRKSTINVNTPSGIKNSKTVPN